MMKDTLVEIIQNKLNLKKGMKQVLKTSVFGEIDEETLSRRSNGELYFESLGFEFDERFVTRDLKGLIVQ